MNDPRIRVLVVDDDPMAAAGITAVLGASTDIDVVGRCADGDEVAAAVAAHHPDVVLCDVRMPRMDGVAVVRALGGSTPRFLMMTAFDEDGRVLDAVSAGASGFMLKDEDPQRIIDAVRQVAAGDAAFSPRAARQLSMWVRDSRGTEARRDAAAKMEQLTTREREFAIAVTDGASDADIAQRFFVAETTVKSTLAVIRGKWGVRTRTELAVVVARSGA
ncbi:response regulator [Leifsonia naganoensis]|uniref:DNA-binding NarL/FixJ family response regulator n=1 Tax=Leifsonia naganoensis TaxID=150025 RepID=A0A853DPH9_9MICO|nr:DNA-binding NarL/FixJ family response regulator [Leifsonia naganoensis]